MLSICALQGLIRSNTSYPCHHTRSRIFTIADIRRFSCGTVGLETVFDAYMMYRATAHCPLDKTKQMILHICASVIVRVSVRDYVQRVFCWIALHQTGRSISTYADLWESSRVATIRCTSMTRCNIEDVRTRRCELKQPCLRNSLRPLSSGYAAMITCVLYYAGVSHIDNL